MEPGESLRGVVNHPLRRRIFEYLSSQVGSPSEIAATFDLALEDVSYHVRRLRDLGAITLVDKTVVRGTVKHIYRAIVAAQSTMEDSVSLRQTDRARQGQLIAELAAEDVQDARRAGSLGQRETDWFSRLAGLADDEALREVREIQLGAERQIRASLAKANSRVSTGHGDARRSVRIVTMVFQAPEPEIPLE